MESQILGALHLGFSLQEIKRLTIPEVLRPYMGGKEKLVPKK